ncbi:MAG TPA: hypothetical protein VJY62_11325 [Bacteroidia bacterium]|nr:hypothetical protein [Bacteroidia bacterium]
MKTNTGFISSAIVCIILFVSCNKKNDISQNATAVSDNSAQRISINPAYRGLYVDNFDNILGDTSQENTLLRWCKKYKIKIISLYDLNTVLQNSSNNTVLAKFIKKSKNSYGMKQVTAIRGLGTQFSQTLTIYNNTRTDTIERFNVFNLENEWWNNGPNCDFSCWTNYLKAMNTSAHTAAPPLLAEEYIGWFQNPAGQEQMQADTLVYYSDRILVHDYRAAPDFPYMQSRLSYLGKAAKAQGKIINVIAIFSAEPNFMGNYFDVNGQNHSFDDAYAEIVSQHNAAPFFSGKNNIKIIGYQVFDYSFAKTVRP